jgi:hypothetical protein
MTPKQRAHMQKMRDARAANRARAAAAAVDADNPIDDGPSVDDMARATPRPRGRPKKTSLPPKKPPAPSLRARRPIVAQPRADYEPERPRRTLNDPDLEERAALVGVGGRTPMGARPDPTVRRDLQHDPHTGRVVVERGGKIYTRRVTNTGDKFHIDASDIPDGMSYQWIASTVAGAEQRQSIAQFQQNGWESVPMSRYPGRYGPEKLDGKPNHTPIIIDGLILCERPIELTIEAREEEISAARQLIRTRNEQFQPKLPGALRERGTGLRAKRSIEGMPSDIGRPVYEMDVDDGLL